MAKFRYRMQNIFDIKEKMENQAKTAYGMANAKLAAEQQKLQDILIRFKKMQGYNALWIPGTDHASIATEVKIINALKEEGIEEGKNLTVEVKNAAADQGTAKQISDGFVSDKVDLVCAIATPSAQSAYNAAKDTDTPVIYTAVTSPKKAGFVDKDGKNHELSENNEYTKLITQYQYLQYNCLIDKKHVSTDLFSVKDGK